MFLPVRYAQTSLFTLNGEETPALKTEPVVHVDKDIDLPYDAEGLRVRISGGGVMSSNADTNTNVHEGESYIVKLSNVRPKPNGRLGYAMDILLEKS